MKTAKTNVARQTSVFLMCCLALFTGNIASGVEIGAEFSSGVGTSDNVGRNASEEDVTLAVAGIDLELSQSSPRLNAEVRSQFDYTYYSDSAFDDEWIGGLAGTLEFNLIDERLIWIVQDNFGQQTSDPFAPASPGNREDVNFFTTGPTLNLLPVGRNSAQVEVLYSSVNFETRNSDDERISANLSVGREIRRGANLSLTVTTESVEFQSGSPAQDFDRNEAFLGFDLAGARNTLGVSLGVTEVEFGGRTSDGILAQLNWTRVVSSNTTFTLSGGTSFSDQGDIFRFDQGNALDLRDTTDTFSSAVPFTSNFVNTSYVVNNSRTSATVGISWRQEDYEGGEPIDRNTTGANFNLRRNLNDSVYVSLNLQYQRRNFIYLNIADDNVSASIETGYQFSPSFTTSLRYSYFERSGDSSVVDVNENRFFLRFSYTPAWGR